MTSPQSLVRVGTAGWTIPRQQSAPIPGEGSHLERYSRAFACVEINSSFHRSHRPATYGRWAASTPEGFRFAVKVPKTITHQCNLAPTREQFQGFLDEVRNLGSKLGPLLLQLPPRQSFEKPRAGAFLMLFRALHPDGPAALEPRHATWFTPEASELLKEYRIARVAADPPRSPEGANPAGYAGLIYYRLHGSPRIYYSSYSTRWLEELAASVATRPPASEAWCIFDNTASGAAFEDARKLTHALTALI